MPTIKLHFSIYQRRHTSHTTCLLRAFILKYVRGKRNDLPEHKIQTKKVILKHLKEIDQSLRYSSSKCDNFIFLHGINTEPTESAVRDF